MTEREQLEQAIAALEAQRAILGDAVVNAALSPMREKLAALQPAPSERDLQRKMLTILFTDIVDSTAMGERLDPEEVLDIMNGALRRFSDAVTHHEGRVARLMGDGLLAFFGAPAGREDDPLRAVRAGLAIQQEARAYAEHVQARWGIGGFAARVGINTGPVALGEVGGAAGSEYTAMGDTINLAARLQSAAPPGGVLISHDTYRHVRGIFTVRPRETISVRGRSEPVQVYLAEAEKPRAFALPTRGVEGVETRMIGREAELLRLQQGLRAVLEGRELQAFTVMGEAGVGKSRLLYEFHKWLELQPEDVRLFKGRASPEMFNLPFALLRNVFSFRFEILDSDPPAVAREKLEQGMVGYLGANDPEAPMRAHFIGHLLGLDFSASPQLRGILDDPQQIHDRAFHYLTQFFTAVTRQLPVVLFLEDLQWADDGSLDLISHLVETCQSIPLFILCLTRRPLFERRPKWGEGQAGHFRLELQALSRLDSRRLVGEILQKVPEVPQALQELIVSAAEGNPFYVEELVKMMIEEGVILTGEGAWRVDAGRLVEIRVPPTLAGVLQARLDGLPPPERSALQRASVVGRVFWDSAVEALGEGKPVERAPSTTTVEALSGLRRKELVFGRETSAFAGSEEYVFKHTLLREVTYESILKRQRRAYHAQAARWLIEQSGERVNEYAGLIAEHYEQATERASAAEWYGRAGHQARAAYAPETAIGYYRRALDLLTPETSEVSETSEVFARQVPIYDGLGEALHARTRLPEAQEAYAAMRAAAEKAGDLRGQARAWEGLADVQHSQGDFRTALESARRAEEIARGAGDAARLELANAFYIRGWSLVWLGDPNTARELGEQILALTADLGEGARREHARGLKLIGLGHRDFEQAIHYHERALAAFHALGDRRNVGATLITIGWTEHVRGDYRAAMARHQQALALAREIGNQWLESAVLSNIGCTKVRLGEYSAGEAELSKVTASVGSRTPFGLSETYGYLAEARLGQGKLTEALEAARTALTLAKAQEIPDHIGLAWRVLGMIAAQLSESIDVGAGEEASEPARTFDATACFSESLRVYTGWSEPERARTLREWARYDLGRGDRAHGEAMWQEARAIFAREGMTLEVERMDKVRGEVSVEREA